MTANQSQLAPPEKKQPSPASNQVNLTSSGGQTTSKNNQKEVIDGIKDALKNPVESPNSENAKANGQGGSALPDPNSLNRNRPSNVSNGLTDPARTSLEQPFD